MERAVFLLTVAARLYSIGSLLLAAMVCWERSRYGSWTRNSSQSRGWSLFFILEIAAVTWAWREV